MAPHDAASFFPSSVFTSRLETKQRTARMGHQVLDGGDTGDSGRDGTPRALLTSAGTGPPCSPPAPRACCGHREGEGPAPGTPPPQEGTTPTASSPSSRAACCGGSSPPGSWGRRGELGSAPHPAPPTQVKGTHPQPGGTWGGTQQGPSPPQGCHRVHQDVAMDADDKGVGQDGVLVLGEDSSGAGGWLWGQQSLGLPPSPPLPPGLPAQPCPPAGAGTHPCPPPPSCCRLQRWHWVNGAAWPPHPPPRDLPPPHPTPGVTRGGHVCPHPPWPHGSGGATGRQLPSAPPRLTALHRGLVALHELPLHELVGQGGFAWRGRREAQGWGRGPSTTPGHGKEPAPGKETALTAPSREGPGVGVRAQHSPHLPWAPPYPEPTARGGTHGIPTPHTPDQRPVGLPRSHAPSRAGPPRTHSCTGQRAEPLPTPPRPLPALTHGAVPEDEHFAVPNRRHGPRRGGGGRGGEAVRAGAAHGVINRPPQRGRGGAAATTSGGPT